MKNQLKILFLFMFLWGTIFKAQKYEDPEVLAATSWRELTKILQKEANYFQGKKGRIRFAASEFTDFKIEGLTITPEKISLSMHFNNRFYGDAFKEQKQSFVYTFDEFDYKLKSVTLLYGETWYFDDFPNTTWLKFEGFSDKIPQETRIREKESESEVWKTIFNEKTSASYFLLPIRSKNREKILKAVDRFQSIMLKKDLQAEIEH